MIGYVGFEFLGRVTLKREKKSEVLDGEERPWELFSYVIRCMENVKKEQIKRKKRQKKKKD